MRRKPCEVLSLLQHAVILPALRFCVIVALHAIGSSFGFGRINHHVTRQFIQFTRLENLSQEFQFY